LYNSNSVPQSAANPSSLTPQKRNASLYFDLGLVCAFVSLFLVPEIFGSASIILGAFTWRLESVERKTRGLLLIIFGIITMLVGIYYTSFFGIYNILP
jgi:hypothetical protein